jgi:hypothetical protein
MMSGARAMIASAVTIRSFADFPPVRSAKMSIPPAASISSETQPMPEITGSSHSAKYTLGRRVKCAAPLARPGKPGGELVGKTISTICRTDHRPEHADHVENLGDSALVEGVDIDALSNKRRHDIGLQVGESSRIFGMSAQVEAVPRQAISDQKMFSACRYCSAGMRQW